MSNIKDIPSTCLVCDKQFLAWRSSVRIGKGKFCSRKCNAKASIVNNRKIKYTEELLRPAVEISKCVSDVMRVLNLNVAMASTHTLISNKIKKYNIDTSHFGNKGGRGGSRTKKSWQDVLIKRTSGGRQAPYRLRNSLVESGVDYVCEKCNQVPYWNNIELLLQIDHIDGNSINDAKDNLRFLCPNCHSQTITFGIRNRKCV